MIIFVIAISVLAAVFAENTHEGLSSNAGVNQDRKFPVFEDLTVNNGWQHAPLVTYTGPKQGTDFYNYHYLGENYEASEPQLVPFAADNITQATTATPNATPNIENNIPIIPIDNIDNNIIVPPDMKCENSEILIDIMNKLVTVLNHNIETGFDNTNKITGILDTIKTYLDETPNSLNHKELNVKFRNLKQRVNDEFSIESKNNFVPRVTSELVYNFNLPGYQNPNCREAFLTIMKIAQNAYDQVANSPICNFNNLPSPYPTNQPKAPELNVNVQVKNNYPKPFHTTLPPYITFKSPKYYEPYFPNAIKKNIVPNQYNNARPQNGPLIGPKYTKMFNVEAPTNLYTENKNNNPNDNELLSDQQRSYIANLTNNQNILNNIYLNDLRKIPTSVNPDQVHNIQYEYSNNVNVNHRITQHPIQSSQIPSQISYISNPNLIPKYQHYVLPSQVVNVPNSNPNSYETGSNVYQEKNTQIIQNRPPQVIPTNIQQSVNTNNDNNKILNESLDKLNNIYKQLSSYLNPTVEQPNLSVPVNSNNYYHYTERSIQGKGIPHSAIAYAHAEAGPGLNQNTAQNGFSQNTAQNYPMYLNPQNMNYVDNPNYIVSNSDNEAYSPPNFQNQNTINVPYSLIQHKSQSSNKYTNYAINKNVVNSKQVLDVTNLSKLNSNSDNNSLIELTYVLKRPNTIVYQPYYVVKYRMPYDNFVTNVHQISQNQNYLRTNPTDLFQNLVNYSNLTEISPGLKDLDQQTIADMVTNNGTILNAKLIGNDNNDKFVNDQLDIVRDFNSQFEMKELDKIVAQLNKLHGSEVNKDKLKMVKSPEMSTIKYEGIRTETRRENGNETNENSSTNVSLEPVTENISGSIRESTERAESLNNTSEEPYTLKHYYKNYPGLHGSKQPNLKP